MADGSGRPMKELLALNCGKSASRGGGERRRSIVSKRMNESGCCRPTIASGRVYGGRFTASTSSSRPFSMRAGQEALRHRTGDEVHATSAETAPLATILPFAAVTQRGRRRRRMRPRRRSGPKAGGTKRISKIASGEVQSRRRLSRTNLRLELMPSRISRGDASAE